MQMKTTRLQVIMVLYLKWDDIQSKHINQNKLGIVANIGFNKFPFFFLIKSLKTRI